MGIEIVKFFNRLGRGTAVDLLTRLVSYIPLLGTFWISVAIAIFFLDSRNGLQISIAMAIAAGLHFGVTGELMKKYMSRFFKRARPYIAYPDEVFSLGKRHTDPTFPSGHMSANLALLSVAVYAYPSVWPAAVVWVLLMAFARMHNGMHYPGDIAAGVVLGILYGTLAVYLVNSFYYVLS